MLLRGLDRLDCQGRCRRGEGGEDPAGVEPANANVPEELLPVDIPRLELAGGGVAPVGDADGPADPEAALGEIEAVADRAADPVVVAPLDEIGVHPTLINEVFDEPADLVVDKRTHQAGPLLKTLPQAAGDVVFAPPFPSLEVARGADPPLAWIEAEHHLAERHAVESTAVLRLDRQRHGGSFGGLAGTLDGVESSCQAVGSVAGSISATPASRASSLRVATSAVEKSRPPARQVRSAASASS